MTKLNLPLTDYSYEWKCCSPRAICGPVQGLTDPGQGPSDPDQGLRIPDSGKCFHSKIATLCQIGWIWKESKTFRSFGCSRIQSSCNLCQISTEMYCFGQVASRTKLSSCWHSSCNEPRGKTQTVPSFQGKLLDPCEQVSSGRRRPRRPGSLSPSFPFSSIAFVLGEQTSGIETRSLRTGTRNLEIQDGEDVDVLRRPASDPLVGFLELLIV